MFLSVSQLAERWGVDERVIYNLRYRRHSPPAMRVGRELRFALHDVEKWEQSQREVLTDA